MARILVADDDADLRYLIRLRLELLGHEVVEAADGAVAIELVTTADVDLAVLDITMPRVTGLEVLATVRAAQGPRSALPVVLLTAMSTEDDVARGMAMGADAYVTKPFSLQRLGERIDAVLADRG